MMPDDRSSRVTAVERLPLFRIADVIVDRIVGRKLILLRQYLDGVVEAVEPRLALHVPAGRIGEGVIRSRLKKLPPRRAPSDCTIHIHGVHAKSSSGAAPVAVVYGGRLRSSADISSARISASAASCLSAGVSALST